MPPSPQTEDGFVRIATELFEAMLRHPFTHRQLKTMHAIVRLTYGWNKKADIISASQIAALTGLKRQHVIVALQDLEVMNAVCRVRVGTRFRVGIQKDYSLWADPKTGSLTDPKSGSQVIPKRDQIRSQNGIKSDPESGPTIDNRQDRQEEKDPTTTISNYNTDARDFGNLAVVSVMTEHPPCPVHAILEAWQTIAVPAGCLGSGITTGSLRKQILETWLDTPELQSVESWERLFRYVASHATLTGRQRIRGGGEFRASLAWLLRDGHLQQVVDGAYEGAA